MSRNSRGPLPMRRGITASRLYLPEASWPDMYSFLRERFQHLPEPLLRQRLQAGDIVDADGIPVRGSSSYRPGSWLWYYRAVAPETEVPFELRILHQDEHIVVVDKPHFLATVPAGKYLEQTALVRLKRMLGNPDLSPLHRLDRETAGLLVFGQQRRHRGAYQQLFQAGQVHKVYEAVAPLCPARQFPLIYESRIEKSPQYFKMQEAAGPPNSRTRISIIASQGEQALYRLQPETGKKHQLRVHMNALGLPICHDSYYPVLQPEQDIPDFSKPLQLLARQLRFKDPLSGAQRCFTSERRLAIAPDLAHPAPNAVD